MIQIKDIINLIDSPIKNKFIELYEDNKFRFEKPNNNFNKIMNISADMYGCLSKFKDFSFKLNDVIIVMFLSNLHMLFGSDIHLQSYRDKQLFIESKIIKYKIELSTENLSAIASFNEKNNYKTTSELFVFCNVCTISSLYVLNFDGRI